MTKTNEFKIIKEKIVRQQGFTLIELLVSIAIMGIVFLMVFSFFITNLKAFYHSSDVIELHDNGQFAMSYLEAHILEAKRILEIRDFHNKIQLNAITQIDMRKIVFETEESGEIFELKMNNKLFHSLGKKGSAKTEVANYIKSILVKPVPKEKSFEGAKGIEIEMILEKGTQTRYFTNVFQFRNYTMEESE